MERVGDLMGWLVVVVGLIVAGVLPIMYSSRYHQLHVWKKCFMCGAVTASD